MARSAQHCTVVIACFMVVLWLTLVLASKRFSSVLHSDIEQRLRNRVLSPMVRPPRDGQACVVADAALLWRVLSNLVSKAFRHTERGRILVTARRDQRSAAQSTNGSFDRPGRRIEVRDTVPGTAASQQALLFEEFYQLHNPQRNAKCRLGLGLAMAKRMA